MEALKLETEYKEIKIERLRGTFTEEGKEYTVGYTIQCNSSFILARKLALPKIEKESLIFTIYGNNITVEQMREFFKLCRTPV